MDRQTDLNPYDSLRGRAWRNLMVSVINIAIDGGLASLEYDEEDEQPSEVRFDFVLPNGLQCRGYVDSRGYGELLFRRLRESCGGPSSQGVRSPGQVRRNGKWLAGAKRRQVASVPEWQARPPRVSSPVLETTCRVGRGA